MLSPISNSFRSRGSLLRGFVAAAIACGVSSISVAANDDLPSVDEARNKVIDRLLALQNISVEYEQTDTQKPVTTETERVVDLGFGKGRMVIVRGREKSTCTFRFLSGRAWYEQHVTDPRPCLPSYLKTMIVSFREDRLERLWQQEDNLPTTLEPLIGEIDSYPQDRVSEPPAVIDIALGLRLPTTGANWLTPEDVRHYEFKPLEDGRVVVTNRQYHTSPDVQPFGSASRDAAHGDQRHPIRAELAGEYTGEFRDRLSRQCGGSSKRVKRRCGRRGERRTEWPPLIRSLRSIACNRRSIDARSAIRLRAMETRRHSRSLRRDGVHRTNPENT